MEYRHFLKVFSSYDIFRGKNLCWYNRASHSGNIILLRFKSNVTVYDFSFGIGLQLPSMCLLNVHLDDLSHTKRTHQIKQLLPFIYRENNIILGGDLNQNYKSTTHLYKLLTDGGLKIYMKDPTYFLDKKMSIDHIMTKGLPHGVSTSVDSYGGDFIKQFKNYGSDHLPVVLNI
jgi:endonuclease/exonuclease/phosphatase (EEP) superfamily protein YafD